MFEKVLAAVLGVLGISAFAKDEHGKSFMTDSQKTLLKDKYGEKFLQAFVKDLSEFEAAGTSAESAVTPEVVATLEAERDQYAKELATARDRAKQLDARIAEMDKQLKERTDQVNAMTREAAPDQGTALQAERPAGHQGFKIDMSLKHNQYLDATFKGAAYSGNETIDTTELQREFGKYVNNERLEIIKGLLGQTESTQYMSTIMTDNTEVRAQQAMIDSVLQQFVPKWSPKGKSKFTPLTIKNYKCKINVPITPSDIMEDILGYLYDENLDPKDMPIVKYILFQLIFPKLDEEREIALAVGEFKATSVTKDGDPGGKAEESMEGYLTQLIKLKKASDEDVNWLLDGVTLSPENILAEIDKAVDAVAPLYKKKAMFIHADPDLVTMYSRAYRAKYPYTKNEDGEKVKVDFSRFTFAPLEGMRGKKAFFITPKENFKHLVSKNPQKTKVRMETQNYDVKIFAEWWEGTGFWLKEAIFAYIPQTLTTSMLSDGI